MPTTYKLQFTTYVVLELQLASKDGHQQSALDLMQCLSPDNY